LKIRVCKALTVSKSQADPSGGIHADNFEILYLTNGRASFAWAGHSCELDAPAVFLIGPSTPHVLESLDPEIGCCFLELSNVNDPFLTTANMDRWNLFQSNKMNGAYSTFTNAIEQSLLFIHRLYVTGEVAHYEELEQACLLELNKIFKLIAYILQSASNEGGHRAGKKSRRSAQEAVNILIDFMEWRYSDEITLKMLADLVYLNPSYLVRVFKEHTQLTPFQYLQNLRLNAATSFLTRSDLPLKVIVEKTGFNSIHYFCRLFRKTYGESPIRWRGRQLDMSGERR